MRVPATDNVFARIRLGKGGQRDRIGETHIEGQATVELDLLIEEGDGLGGRKPQWLKDCLLYTSDAADERSSVDLGGRRILKKKKKQ